MRKEDCFFLGHISKKHGFKGTVRVHLDTDRPEAYHQLESVFVERNGQLVPFFIRQCQAVKGNNLLVDFDGVEGEAQANALIGSGLYLPLSFLPPLSGTQFYFHEVEGFQLVDEQGNHVGPIVQVMDQTAQLLFEVKHKNNLILVPVVEEWIVRIDREQKEFILRLPEGLLNLYEEDEKDND